MGAILLVKSSAATRIEVGEAVSKFQKIFGEEVVFDNASSVSRAIGLMKLNLYSLVFIDKDLSLEDLNLLRGAFLTVKSKPIIVTSPHNLELLTDIEEPKQIQEATHGLLKGCVFKYLRQAIINKDRKIDPRIFASILRGVMKVVKISSGMTLIPQQISTLRSQSETSDMTAVCSFYGDGLQSSLTVSASELLMSMMTSSALSLPPEEISTELKVDFLLEIMNQLVGAVRQELGEFGYELTPTIFFVAAGEGHTYFSRSNGKYIVMPFTSQDQPFKVTFCYDVYADLARPAEPSHNNHNPKQYLDVRLVDGAIRSVSETISANLNVACRHVGDKTLSLGNDKAELVSVVHGVGHGANYTFLMRLKQEHARLMASRLLQMPPAEIAIDMVADSCGEILQQIVAQFRHRAAGQGYPFRPVFHSDFSRAGQVDYVLNVQGKFVVLTFETEDFPFEISFGVDSIRTPALFDVHEWLGQSAPSQRALAAS